MCSVCPAIGHSASGLHWPDLGGGTGLGGPDGGSWGLGSLQQLSGRGDWLWEDMEQECALQGDGTSKGPEAGGMYP